MTKLTKKQKVYQIIWDNKTEKLNEKKIISKYEKIHKEKLVYGTASSSLSKLRASGVLPSVYHRKTPNKKPNKTPKKQIKKPLKPENRLYACLTVSIAIASFLLGLLLG